ncbi:hypothetical protein CDAR_584281 [Caerostris darwini]|uniref:Uncharacterized protein n=1 Tax=Caerostris darwini TaxID=1538125 RepID=A0AAV4WG91_9ARAC|nr:hypothetical protein CDAR_584281 [Caerostris darwini]
MLFLTGGCLGATSNLNRATGFNIKCSESLRGVTTGELPQLGKVEGNLHCPKGNRTFSAHPLYTAAAHGKGKGEYQVARREEGQESFLMAGWLVV